MKIREINRKIFNLNPNDPDPKKAAYAKHLQNLVWAFFFGTLLHKED